MARYFLIRHGEIDWIPGNPSLTTLGQTQAAAVGAFLKGQGIARLYTSPMRRTRETARIIAEILNNGISVEDDPRLRERMNWGDVEDQNWEEFDAEWDRASIDRDYMPLGGISARMAANNLDSFMREKALAYPTESIAAVTHGGILGDYLTEYVLPDDLARLHPDWAERKGAVITHCSITILNLDGADPRLEALAVVKHQPGEQTAL